MVQQGGLAFILIGVGNKWYLLSWQHAYKIGDYTQKELLENCVAYHDMLRCGEGGSLDWAKQLVTRKRGKLISVYKPVEVDLL